MGWIESKQQVFVGDTPANFTDLDLSAIVGAKATLVLIKCFSTSGDAKFKFRIKGDTANSDCDSCCSAYEPGYNNRAGYVILATNNEGIVQWEGGYSAKPAVLTLQGFLS